jgi:DNA polymerase III delta prime subunit
MYSLGKDREMLLKEGKQKSMVDPTLNFTFCGNPGCGKTETARLFAKILVKSGIRHDNYVEVTGQNAIKMGAKEFSKMLFEKRLIIGPKSDSPAATVMPSDKFLEGESVEVQQGDQFIKACVVKAPGNKVQGLPNSSLYDVQFENGHVDSIDFKNIRRVKLVGNMQGGVLFIDEAYQLNPAHDEQGKKIFEELLDISENCRTTLTVILGGYRKEIEEKLFDFNPGMSGRFENVPFDDFLEMELESIFKKMCKDKLCIAQDNVCAVVRRRLSRRRGKEGFGNARDVRSIFDKANGSAAHRWRLECQRINAMPPAEQPRKPALEIIVTDVIGLRPSRETNPKVPPHELWKCESVPISLVFGRSSKYLKNLILLLASQMSRNPCMPFMTRCWPIGNLKTTPSPLVTSF